MAKANAQRSTRTIRHQPDAKAVRRFLDSPARETRPTERTVRPGSVDVEARTLSAVVATNASRLMEVWDDHVGEYITVEEIVLVEGMDLSRVDTGMQFLDNHNTWDLEANLGRVTAAQVEDVEGTGPAVVVDIEMSSRPALDWLVQDLANDIVGCISCQYRPIESTLEQRDGQYPLLTHTKSELLEVSLVSVPADKQASVRSETPVKGKPMAGKPNGARAAAQRALAVRTQKRAEDTTVTPPADGAIDEATIAEIVEAVIEEVVPAVVDEVAAAAADDAGAGEPEARAEDTTEEDDKDKGGAGTDMRSMVRSAVAKALGRSATPGAAVTPKVTDELTKLRSMADKYGVRSQFTDMEAIGTPIGELRSFIVNATAARSGTGQTHDGRNSNPQRGELSFANSFRGKRAAERATRR